MNPLWRVWLGQAFKGAQLGNLEGENKMCYCLSDSNRLRGSGVPPLMLCSPGAAQMTAPPLQKKGDKTTPTMGALHIEYEMWNSD